MFCVAQFDEPSGWYELFLDCISLKKKVWTRFKTRLWLNELLYNKTNLFGGKSIFFLSVVELTVASIEVQTSYLPDSCRSWIHIWLIVHRKTPIFNLCSHHRWLYTYCQTASAEDRLKRSQGGCNYSWHTILWTF